MRGIDEARAFYEENGRKMLHTKFPEYEGRIAVGLVGHGSQCFGFDDDVSRDHDFVPGFCMWLTDIDDIKIGAELAEAYRELPAAATGKTSLMGDTAVGVRRTGFFYSRYTGSEGPPESLRQWMAVPSWALAEATNGEVFRDDLGQFSAVREVLLHGMPEDVRLKKLSARAFTMAQAGQYNYSRCLSHGEAGAAMLAMNEFVIAAADMIYLLNRRHMPYYKWALRGMDGLETLGGMKGALEYLLTGDNDESGQKTKSGVIEDVCANVIAELKVQQLTHGGWDFLEPHAFEIAERIQDPEIRSLNISEG
jgi:hypothetical protein